MSAPVILLWTIVFAVGVPSAWRNPTAGALVLCKIAGWVIFKLTGNSLPVEWYFYPDFFVVMIVYCKPDYQPCDFYKSTWHQLKCIAIERSPADRAVLLIFAMMWALYLTPDAALDPYYKWYSLWAGVILQFLFASAESLEIFWRSRSIVKRHLGDFTHSCFAAFSGVHPVFLPRAAELIIANGGGGDG